MTSTSQTIVSEADHLAREGVILGMRIRMVCDELGLIYGMVIWEARKWNQKIHR